MSLKQIVNMFGSNDEELMDCDPQSPDFTQYYLLQYNGIEQETIDALINEGYTTKLSLLALDEAHDLPLIKLPNLAQRSLLRIALRELRENENFLDKIRTVKGEDLVPATSRPSLNPAVNGSGVKRKPETIESKRAKYARTLVQRLKAPQYQLDEKDSVADDQDDVSTDEGSDKPPTRTRNVLNRVVARAKRITQKTATKTKASVQPSYETKQNTSASEQTDKTAIVERRNSKRSSTASNVPTPAMLEISEKIEMKKQTSRRSK